MSHDDIAILVWAMVTCVWTLAVALYIGDRLERRARRLMREHEDQALVQANPPQLSALPLDPESRWMLTDPFDEQGDLVVGPMYGSPEYDDESVRIAFDNLMLVNDMPEWLR